MRWDSEKIQRAGRSVDNDVKCDQEHNIGIRIRLLRGLQQLEGKKRAMRKFGWKTSRVAVNSV